MDRHDNGTNRFFRRDTGTQSPNSPRKRRRSLGIMPLEPRIMYDGAAAATAAHHHHHADHGDAGSSGASGSAVASGVVAATTGAPPDGGAGANHPGQPAWMNKGVSDASGTRGWTHGGPSEIMFVDPQVPNYQTLVDGAKPGVKVVVLDPNKDGLQQIADYLNTHHDRNLTTIDIVAHGGSGEMMLGSSFITDATLSNDSAALAQIGQALGPNGAVLLFGCNIANGPAGLQFIGDLSKDAGGVDVVASTHSLGQLPDGTESWTLDAATGAVVATTPFTAGTMANFTGLLGDTAITTTGNSPVDPTVTTLPNGDYVVAWLEVDPATANPYVVASIFNSTGTALATDISLTDVNTDGAFDFSLAALPANAAASLPDGGFVVAYENQPGTGADDLDGRIFDVKNGAGPTATATQVGSEFQISTDTNDTNDLQQNPSIAVAPNGSFLVAWDLVSAAPLTGNIEAQRYNSLHQAVHQDGATLGAANFQVNTTTATNLGNSLELPTAAFLTDSDFVIAWQANGANGTNESGITAGLFNTNGSLIGNEFKVDGGGDNLSPSLAALTGGGFVISWAGGASNSAVSDVDAIVYNASAQMVANRMQGSAVAVASGVNSPNVTANPADGGFLIEWNDNAGGIFAQRLDANGNDLGSQFRIDTGQTSAAITPDGGENSATVDNGQVVAVFGSSQSGGSIFSDTFTMHSAPQGTNNSKTIVEPNTYTFAASDFGFSDPHDNPADSFLAVDIASVPTGGTLKDNGVTVTAGQLVLVSDITAGDLVYTPPANAGSFHFTFQVEDNGGTGNGSVNLDPTARTFTFNVEAPPVIGGTGNTGEFYQGGAAVTVDGGTSGITVTDPNGVNITGATVTLTGTFSTSDVLADNGVTNGHVLGNISASYNATTHVLTLSGSDTAADYQTALREVSYDFTGEPTNAGADRTRTVTWSVTDADSLTNTGSATSTVDVFAKPVVVAGAAATFTSSSGPVLADQGLTITDFNGTTIAGSATVQITAGAGTGDTLSFDNGATSQTFGDGKTITATFAGTTLTLSGTASVGDYQQALDEVQFSTSTNGTSGARTLTWVVDDKAGGNANPSAGATSTVNVQLGPAVAGGVTVNDTEGASTGPITTLATFTDSAINNPTAGNFTATIDWGDGSATTSGSVSGPDTNGVFTVSSTTGHTYAEEGSHTITVTVTDTTNNTTGSATDTASIADAPLTAGTVTVGGGVEGVTPATLSATFTDANPNGSPADFTATVNWGDGTQTTGVVTENAGVFSVAGTHIYADEHVNEPVSVTIQDVGGSVVTESTTTTVADAPLTAGTVTASGGAAGVTPTTLSATFTDANHGAPTSDFSGTVNWGDGSTSTFTNGNVSGSNGAFTVSGLSHLYAADGTYNVAVTINDTGGSTTTETGTASAAPTITAGGTDHYIQYELIPPPLDSTVAAGPGGPLTGATVSISSGFLPGDLLTFVNQNGISGSYDAAHGVLTLTGTASVANYNTALESIRFASFNANPTSDGADLTRTISWTVKDGGATSAAATSTVDVTGVPTVLLDPLDPNAVTFDPLGISIGGNVSYQAGPGTSVVLDPTAAVFDGTNITKVTVSIVSGIQPSDTLSANTAGTSIHASYSNGVLTLTGSDTPQDYTKVLDTVKFSSNQSQNGLVVFAWQASDANFTGPVSLSTATVSGNLAPPPDHGRGLNGDSGPHNDGGHDGPFGMWTNVQAQGGFPGFSTAAFTAGNAVFVVHAEIDPTVGPDGKIDFNVPLIALEAPLNGDVVSVVATLADGKPLPSWLAFNPNAGKFAGIVPDILTGSIPPGSAVTGSPSGGGNLQAPPEQITIELVARDSKGNISILDFTIDLTGNTKHAHHGWNLPTRDPWTAAPQRQQAALGAHHDIVLPPALDGAADHAHSGRGHAADRAHVPAGRAGLSSQLASLGWRGIDAGRTALLDSLRHIR